MDVMTVIVFGIVLSSKIFSHSLMMAILKKDIDE